MTEAQVAGIAHQLAGMTNKDLAQVFRVVAAVYKDGYLENINCAMRRVCIEQENLRLVKQ